MRGTFTNKRVKVVVFSADGAAPEAPLAAMPHLLVNGCHYFYQDVGCGPETLVFGPGYSLTHHQFAPQIEALKGRYRCVAFDWRGQGRSSVTRRGYGLASLTADLIALMEQMGVGPCHYVGFSMGGYVGYRLALRRPDLLKSITLMATSAGAEPPVTLLRYYVLLSLMRLLGTKTAIEYVLPLYFSPAFRCDPARQEQIQAWKDIITSNDDASLFRAGLAIFSRGSVLEKIHQIRTPVLLAVGEHDVPTPMQCTLDACARMPQAEVRVFPGLGHCITIEAAEAVTEILGAFVNRHATPKVAAPKRKRPTLPEASWTTAGAAEPGDTRDTLHGQWWAVSAKQPTSTSR